MPDEEILKKKTNVNYLLNEIIQYQGLILGSQGTGKSCVARWLAGQLISKYGTENVNSIWTEGNLRLLSHGVEDTLVIFLDDITLMPVDKDSIGKYFGIDV